MKILVTGAGGMIGHHLVKRLKADGHYVRGADLKAPEFCTFAGHELLLFDLRHAINCMAAIEGMELVYHCAANMGGIGLISKNHAEVARDNTLMDLNMLEASWQSRTVKRFLYTSSACAYALYKQEKPDVRPLREKDAFPADPEPGYGWEKLYMEQLLQYYREDYGFETRIARLHNVYGTEGTWTGGREKAPAAICRKVAEAQDGGNIEIWGDGHATRSFMWIDDCVEGLVRLMRSSSAGPMNLGTSELVTIDELVDMVCEIAGKKLVKIHDPTKPQGVRGRNADIRLAKKALGWEPKVGLRQGLGMLYPWVAAQVNVARDPAPPLQIGGLKPLPGIVAPSQGLGA